MKKNKSLKRAKRSSSKLHKSTKNSSAPSAAKDSLNKSSQKPGSEKSLNLTPMKSRKLNLRSDQDLKVRRSSSRSLSEKQPSIQTFNIHGNFSTKSWEFSNHLVPPMTASTTFRLKSLKRGAEGFQNFADPNNLSSPIWIYDRLEEPSSKMLEEQLARMESGECAVSFSSGMGAISGTLISQLRSGDKILAHKTLYGCSYSLITQWLPRLGIQPELISVNDITPEQLKDKKIRIIYFESVANPSLEIIDIPKLVKLVKAENKSRKEEHKILLVVDNTFPTPWGLRPLELGVDFVIQSLTKNIAGFGTEMGGAVITFKKYQSSLLVARKDFGAIMHPHSAWNIMVYGIPSQVLRFEAQQKNALEIAHYLESHPKIEKVIYPGLASHPQYKLAQKLLNSPEGKFSPGTMLSFILKGTDAQTENFINHIANSSYSITLAVSLGLTKTLIEVPGLMTHAAVPKQIQESSGIPAKLVRLSLGIESIDDIISDLDNALKRI